ncbi:MAG: carbohydrate ABC transporter permease [Phycisphaerae bacterium]
MKPSAQSTRELFIRRLLVQIALVLVAVMYLAPLLWMLDTSLKTEHQAMAQLPSSPARALSTLMIPHPLHPANYRKVISSPFFRMQLYARNTLIIALLVALGSMLSASLVAYALTKLRWYGRNVLFWIVMGSMMLPFSVMMVPLYRIYREFGWIGTNLPLWLPTFLAPPFYVFLLRQFYLTIPNELTEAAVIDGAGPFRVWWYIMVPLTRPALLVVGIFSFVASWNNFIGPLVYLTHQRTYTLALALQFFQTRHGGVAHTLLMAATVLVVLPIIIIFFLAQKTFIRGIATTGIKG